VALLILESAKQPIRHRDGNANPERPAPTLRHSHGHVVILSWRSIGDHQWNHSDDDKNRSTKDNQNRILSGRCLSGWAFELSRSSP
jgi:hypothetical protein